MHGGAHGAFGPWVAALPQIANLYGMTFGGPLLGPCHLAVNEHAGVIWGATVTVASIAVMVNVPVIAIRYVVPPMVKGASGDRNAPVESTVPE